MTEIYSKDYSRTFKIDRLFFEGTTGFQKVHCFSNDFLGKALFIDEKIQSAQVDEFIYHESLVQPAMVTHPHPQDVLVIGGGEGATLREVLKHSSVRQVTMVDIDKKLIDICREYLPEWSDGAFTDSRTDLIYMDARKFLKSVRRKFDVIISDLTDPVERGTSVHLFTEEFFQEIKSSLKEKGQFVLQAGSIDPFFCQFFILCSNTLETVFPVVQAYWTFVPSFALPWGFVLAAKSSSPSDTEPQVLESRLKTRNVRPLKFYHSRLHRAMFSLPLFLEEALHSDRILTDENPFVWEL